MSELTEYLKERYLSKNRSEVQEQMKKQQVKNTILKVCDENLTDADAEFIFEAWPSDLPYVAIVIEEEPLKSKYDIYQISETMFVARLKEFQL